jgi:hypothetical protein
VDRVGIDAAVQPAQGGEAGHHGHGPAQRRARRRLPVEDRRQGAQDPEAHENESGHPEAAASECAGERPQSGHGDHDAGDQHRLVGGAEGGDGPVLDPGGDVVDDDAAHRLHERGYGGHKSCHRFGQPQGGEGSEETRNGGTEALGHAPKLSRPQE